MYTTPTPTARNKWTYTLMDAMAEVLRPQKDPVEVLPPQKFRRSPHQEETPPHMRGSEMRA